MPAYMLIETCVHDDVAFARYVEAVGPLIGRYGGTVVAKTVSPVVLEGPDRSTAGLLQFASLEAARTFWHSADYARVKALRAGVADFFVTLIPGADEDTSAAD